MSNCGIFGIDFRSAFEVTHIPTGRKITCKKVLPFDTLTAAQIFCEQIATLGDFNFTKARDARKLKAGDKIRNIGAMLKLLETV